MKVRPLKGRVLVKRLETVTATKSGLILAGGERPQLGHVIASGDDEIPKGSLVMFPKYHTRTLKVVDEAAEYLSFLSGEILAVIDEH